MSETKEMVASILGTLKEYVSAATKPLREKNALLEGELALLRGELQFTKDQVSAALVNHRNDVNLELRALVEREVAALPLAKDGKDGRDGIDGKDGESVDVVALHHELSEMVAAIPMPKDGKDGRDGTNGRDGEAGKDGTQIDVDLLRKGILEMIPVPKDGRDGKDGKDIDPAMLNDAIDTKVAAAVAVLPLAKDGRDGKDGVNADPAEVASLVAAAVGELREAGALKGTDGKDGRDGKDAEEVDYVKVKEHINVVVDDQVRAVFADIPKPQDGINGKDGRDGVDGKDGISVKEEDVRLLVQRAVEAVPPPINGTDGQDGQDGEPGPAGRDALDLNPIPAVEFGKSYPRGTWAYHGGGLIKAHRNTDPIVDNGTSLLAAGWELAVRGIADVTIVQPTATAPRSLLLVVNSTDEVKRFDVKLPVLIYKEIWKAGEYEQGDAVTRGGSVWIATKKTSAQPGQEPFEDWVLAVKHGRDGKDAEPIRDRKVEPIKLK